MAMTPPPSSSIGVDAVGNPSPNSRSMRLKVSYTFDDEGKAQCLARWPHPINTPVVEMEDKMMVGAVEFKTCILSMISASPELVASLSQDYSVYSYDYSEAGVPLVGCGMLSWAMLNTQNSTTKIMITGKVNRNTFGFFSNDGVQETLEVKLRLQRVDTFTQEQFVQSVHTYSTMSRMLPGDFDASAWSSFLQAHPQILAEQGRLQHSLTSTKVREITQGPEQATSPDWQPLQPPPPPSTRNSRAASTLSTDDVVQPPRKKARTTAPRKRPAKKDAAKKKSTPTAATSTTSTPREPESSANTPVHIPVDPPSQESGAEQGSTPALVQEPFVAAGFPMGPPSEVPPSEASPNMASSPPEPRIYEPTEYSPAPTSPAIQDLDTNLDHLFEEEESVKGERENDGTQMIQREPNRSLMLPAPPANDEVATPPAETSAISMPPPPKDEVATSPPDSSAIMSDSTTAVEKSKPKPRNRAGRKSYARSSKHVKERIEAQLQEAISKGQMPTYCLNCGAIETPVWRKVKLKDDTVEVEEGQEYPEKEVVLCNPCGLWYGAHKNMRPQIYWDGRHQAEQAKKAIKPKKKRQRPTAAPTPASQPLGEGSTAPPQAPSPPQEADPVLVIDEASGKASIRSPPAGEVTTKKAVTPDVDRVGNPEWSTAIEKAKRVMQSSPIQGSAVSPIDLDAVDSPRRLLFHTPKQRVATTSAPVPSPPSPNGDKENVNPSPRRSPRTRTLSDNTPKTPSKNKQSAAPQTPVRSASKISPWKTGLLSSATRRLSGTPQTPERRLARSDTRNSLSPAAGLLEKLISENNNFLSLDTAGTDDMSVALSSFPGAYDIAEEDFFNTDLTMPSSPPQFDLLGTEQPDDWFLPSSPDGGAFELGDLFGEQEQQSEEEQLTVDLSAFIESLSATSGNSRPASEKEDDPECTPAGSSPPHEEFVGVVVEKRKKTPAEEVEEDDDDDDDGDRRKNKKGKAAKK